MLPWVTVSLSLTLFSGCFASPFLFLFALPPVFPLVLPTTLTLTWFLYYLFPKILTSCHLSSIVLFLLHPLHFFFTSCIVFAIYVLHTDTEKALSCRFDYHINNVSRVSKLVILRQLIYNRSCFWYI